MAGEFPRYSIAIREETSMKSETHNLANLVKVNYVRPSRERWGEAICKPRQS